MFLAGMKESDKLVATYEAKNIGNDKQKQSPSRKGLKTAPSMSSISAGDSVYSTATATATVSSVRFSEDDDIVDTSQAFGWGGSCTDSVVDPAADWNLDAPRMKKLKKIITYHYDKKHKTKKYSGKSRKEIRNIEIENMIAANKGQYIQDRLRNLGVTLIYRCAITGDENGLRNELVIGKCNVNHRSGSTGRNVLHEAVSCGHFHIVKMLLGEFHADVHVRTQLGYTTALHLAVEQNYRQIASILITYGADVNATDRLGCSVLHRVKSEPLLRLLMRYDVEFSVKSHEGLSPSEHYIKYMKECCISEFIPEFGVKLAQLEEESYLSHKKEADKALKELVAKSKAEYALNHKPNVPDPNSKLYQQTAKDNKLKSKDKDANANANGNAKPAPKPKPVF